MQCKLSTLLALCLLHWAHLVVSQDCCRNASNINCPEGKVTLELVGVPGPEGLRGEKGVKGSIGLSGMKGEKGRKGIRGTQGVQGPIGGPGLPGLVGQRGPRGPEGPQGQKGSQGHPGQPGLFGQKGARGPEGPEGKRGPQGVPGLAGPPGLQGPHGDTVLSQEEFAKVVQTLEQNISAELSRVGALVKDIQSAFTKCGIYSTSWRRVAHIDMTDPTTRCPTGLREVSNATTNQRACGKSVSKGCSSLEFHARGNYTHVCGQVRGYQYGEIEAFNAVNIDTHYAEGVLITSGSPRRHLWTYAVGRSETHGHGCPCSAGGSYSRDRIPTFVGMDYYCESGFTTTWQSRIAWEDPLWDGAGCVTPGNTCCQRHGWFHKQVQQTSDSIEVRWCACCLNEDVFTDILEIWVL